MEEEDIGIALEIYERVMVFHAASSPYRDIEIHNEILNQLACCYRRLNRTEDALQFLKKSLNLCESRNLNSGLTFNNMAAVYNQKGMHKKALKMSQFAVKELYPNVINNCSDNNVKLLGIAYFNCGNEEFLLGDLNASMISFERGLKILKKSHSQKLNFLRDRLKKGLMKSRAKFNAKRGSKISTSRSRKSNTRGRRNNKFPSRIHTDISQPRSLQSNKQSKIMSKRHRKKSLKKTKKLVDIPGLKNKGTLPSQKHKTMELGEFRTKNMYVVNEYSAIEDIKRTDKIQFFTPLKTKMYSPYKKVKPRHNNDPSGLITTKNFRGDNSGIFDGNRSKKIRKNNFITHNSKKGKDSKIRIRGDRGEHYYDEKEYNQLNIGPEEAYQAEDGEIELLGDSWEEDVNSSSDEERESQLLKRNKKCFLHDLKHAKSTEDINPKLHFKLRESRDDRYEKNNRYEQSNSEDLEDWTPEPSQELIESNLNKFKIEKPRPGTAVAKDRLQSAGGSRIRSLNEPKFPSRLEEIDETETIKVSDIQNSLDPRGINQNLMAENTKLKEENRVLYLALEKEKERNRLRKLKEEREKDLRERQQSAIRIQKGWKYYSSKRSERNLIQEIENNGFKLLKKIWCLIPFESGGNSPSKLLVFEGEENYHITARDVKTQITRGLSVEKNNREISIESFPEKLSIGSDDNLKYRDIQIVEISNEGDTEDPIIGIGIEEEDSDGGDAEQPLFPPENSVSGEKEKLVNDVVGEVIDKENSTEEDEKQIESMDYDEVENLIVESGEEEVDVDDQKESGEKNKFDEIQDIILGDGDEDEFIDEEEEKKQAEDEEAVMEIKKNAARFLSECFSQKIRMRKSNAEKIYPLKIIIELENDKKYFISIYTKKGSNDKKIECYGLEDKIYFNVLIISEFKIQKLRRSFGEELSEIDFNKKILKNLLFDLEKKTLELKEEEVEPSKHEEVEDDQFDCIDNSDIDHIETEGLMLDSMVDNDQEETPLFALETNSPYQKVEKEAENEDESPLISSQVIEVKSEKEASIDSNSAEEISADEGSHGHLSPPKTLDELDKSDIGVNDDTLLHKTTLNAMDFLENQEEEEVPKSEEKIEEFDFNLDPFYQLNYMTKNGKKLLILFRDNINEGFVQVEAYPKYSEWNVENLLDKHKIDKDVYKKPGMSDEDWQKKVIDAILRGIRSDEDDKISLDDVESFRDEKGFFELMED